mgnify:CR=1 FL=1
MSEGNTGLTWLKSLPLEISMVEVSNTLVPKQEVGPQDHVLGEVSEDLKRLFALRTSVVKQGAQLMVDANFGGSEGMSKEDIHRKMIELKNKGEVLNRLFWVGIYEQFNCWEHSSIGVRNGWLAVWTDDDDDDGGDMPGFLKKLLGGD